MKKPDKKNSKILAIIPARSGSKGIKNKNIRDFCGKPLIYYTISDALKSKKLNRVIVSTDSLKYSKLAESFGAEVPYLRPKKLAENKSLIADVILHLLKELQKKEGYEPDYIMLLQPTSPLRTLQNIDESIDLVLSNKCDGLVSICSNEQLLYCLDKIYLKLVHKKSWLNSTNRQLLPQTYKLNGSSIYIIKTKVFQKNKSFLMGKILGYVMDKWQSVDLDTEEDFRLAELIYKNKKIFL